MPLSDMLTVMETRLRQVEASPRVAQALATMDTGIRFMTQRGYASPNTAVAAIRGPLVAGMWVILALLLVILGWGMLAPIESAAVAAGKVVLLSNKKTIQHLEGGVIDAILVKDGDTVTAGQPLLRLNDTSASANANLLQGQLYAARAAVARLVAERDKKEGVLFDDDMVQAAKDNEDLANTMAAQARLFASSRASMQAKDGVLRQRIAESGKAIEGLKAQAAGTDAQLATLAEELDGVQQLLTKGYATKTRLFELQRHQSELQGARGQYAADIAKTQENIAETELAIVDQQKEFESKNSQELRDAQGQVAELQDKLRAARDVAGRTVITAPVGGIVTGLKYHTAGGVIAPATPIMDIVPQDDQLVIEAHVKPTDISVVHAGQEARVLFSAYKMRTTPKVPGKVSLVSADSFTDDHGAAYYTVRVEVDKGFLRKLAHPIELYPGMPANVMVKTGSRSFLGYLFQPISDSMQGAFREK